MAKKSTFEVIESDGEWGYLDEAGRDGGNGVEDSYVDGVAPGVAVDAKELTRKESVDGTEKPSVAVISNEKKGALEVSPTRVPVDKKEQSGITSEKKRRAGRPRKDSGVQEREVSASVQIHLVAPSDLFRDFQLLCRMRGMSVSGAIKNLMKSELKKNASTFEKAKQLWNL